MTTSCTRSFDEEQLSGYLDGALPQASAQRVRIHLEDCADCAQLHTEMKTLREAARSTHFEVPAESEWPELPQGGPSWLSRSLGWTVLISWALALTAIVLWGYLSGHHDPWELFRDLGLPVGLVLLFVSVLLDRLKDLKTDRYRGVHR